MGSWGCELKTIEMFITLADREGKACRVSVLHISPTLYNADNSGQFCVHSQNKDRIIEILIKEDVHRRHLMSLMETLESTFGFLLFESDKVLIL
jgi:hypothetical protein